MLRPGMATAILLLLPISSGHAETAAPAPENIPPAAETSVAAGDASPLVRGHRLLAEKRYDEAIEAFTAALELDPSTETHIGLATAMLRGRKVLQPGDTCDPARYRAELKAHYRVEEITFTLRCVDLRYFEPDAVESRLRELAEAIEHLEVAAKTEPESVSIHEQIASAKIAFSQFEEEARLRSTIGDIRFATESDFGKVMRTEAFDLPSQRLWSGEMYTTTRDN
jgi:tetratricopeptide (TPR) repeat protein